VKSKLLEILDAALNGRNHATDRARRSGPCGFAAALAVSTAVFAAPAAADSCTKLSSLVLPEVISIAATSIAADSFTPPGLTTPVPVALCRIHTCAGRSRFFLPRPGCAGKRRW